jgi:hypothetical protein
VQVKERQALLDVMLALHVIDADTLCPTDKTTSAAAAGLNPYLSVGASADVWIRLSFCAEPKPLRMASILDTLHETIFELGTTCRQPSEIEGSLLIFVSEGFGTSNPLGLCRVEKER